ncbi:DUF3343 domain-containing protein [Enterococcus termitis]|uniref:Putative Se/S carrier protein-like domain-containing protein n=1 Tax=Enterococcus termitis TaxID=332950 RepID=A0A1E5GCT0_9ENTE|nr:DUF3343 domain-containing protein [Enterococcus termitis]ECB9822675.1 DUF3343 domain-containing protein [Listeria monocytogenes]ECB9834746.1 DUF3343 domain-containing protein [Listeria monocytogenes]OEG10489.1 hypothetical protein BCR25_08400 [Enterococcus termitis]OJG97474.1 hypothetical protein RV18_GL000755 [Enterococcus termitis]
MKQFYLFVFTSTHAAMESERLLQAAQIQARLIPTPEKIIADCGLSLQFHIQALETVSQLLNQQQITTQGLYQGKQTGLHTTFEKVLVD